MALRKTFPARDIMKQADADGFTVVDVCQSSVGMKEDGRPKEWATVELQTPYCDAHGHFLGAKGSVNMQDREAEVSGYANTVVLKDMFPYGDVMLTLGGRNIEDLAAMRDKHPDAFEIFDADGHRVSYVDALDSCGKVMSAAVEFPHVFTFKEYKDVSIPLQDAAHRYHARRSGVAPLDLPAETRYNWYLDKVSGEIGGDIRYVGRVTTRREFERFRDDYEMSRISDEMTADVADDYEIDEPSDEMVIDDPYDLDTL